MNKIFWKDKKVLITGHTGFKGSWLSFWLRELGSEICGISLEPEPESLFNQINLIKKISSHNIIDLTNSEEIRKTISNFKPDIIFHLAAQPLVKRSYSNPLLTWETNLIGSLKVLEACKSLNKNCSVIMITTDKVYENKNWTYGYRESDTLGGHDPYSASKAGAEIAISSWRDSFCGKLSHQTPNISISTARSGNVIGGGDWAEDRLIPDAIKSLREKKPIIVRNPNSTRPWQHVLEPLLGYMMLAELNYEKSDQISFCDAYNFGPSFESNKKVEDVVKEILNIWEGEWIRDKNNSSLHEANLLHLNIDKAYRELNWMPKWNFSLTINQTINWYKNTHLDLITPEEACKNDIEEFMNTN